ncbi:hypothetical protein NLG97_g4502 [Lecanicillium saksenae]|uniref:Uncharacterized protein n=1 Tax=Lecanicillium saksenae TaxID=468837 RepID=A0ACC1QV55_9HYPO|nr:hypothetical protein NLG97_g4502 [Lecanicillium saksenae]
MRRRFFSQDPRYIALKELNGEGNYRRERVGSDASGASATYTPGFKKRMSDAFSRRSSGSLSFSSSTRWKRSSLSRAATATRDVFAAIPLCCGARRGHAHAHDREQSAEMMDLGADKKEDKKRMGFRKSWVQGWKTLPVAELGGTFTIAHTMLFIPIA